MPKAKSSVVGIKWVSKAGLKRALDSRARRVLGISGVEFEARFKSGAISRKSLDGKSGTIELATICSFTKDGRAGKKRKSSR
jgi:hypothetical protein